MNGSYIEQLKLLLGVLPEVAKENCFAMHGGTAINLFVRDMPRLSVDIDLTYIEIAERSETLDGINAALKRIKERIELLRETLRVQHKENTCKLLIDDGGVLVKIEVNMVGRGLIGSVLKLPLCDSAQEQFDVFCVMPLVPIAQLYGGKICAALDRQHPRDLFDIRLLFDNEGFTNYIKKGFMLGLVSSNRPALELLNPHLLDQRTAFENQFEGMSAIEFTYAEFEATRVQLIETIQSGLNKADKDFILSVNRLLPEWSTYDFQKFPSVRWKLLNLEKFKAENPEHYQLQLSSLEEFLAR